MCILSGEIQSELYEPLKHSFRSKIIPKTKGGEPRHSTEYVGDMDFIKRRLKYIEMRRKGGPAFEKYMQKKDK